MAQRGFEEGAAGISEQAALTRGDLAGVRGRGEAAGELEADFLGLSGPEAEARAIAGFQESPGQVFLRERQERALLRNASATGELGGGNVLTALQEQAAGIASTQLGDRLDRLRGVAGGGTQATIAGAGIGANAAANEANLRAGGASARASGISAGAAGFRRGVGGALNLASGFQKGGLQGVASKFT